MFYVITTVHCPQCLLHSFFFRSPSLFFTRSFISDFCAKPRIFLLVSFAGYPSKRISVNIQTFGSVHIVLSSYLSYIEIVLMYCYHKSTRVSYVIFLFLNNFLIILFLKLQPIYIYKTFLLTYNHNIYQYRLEKLEKHSTHIFHPVAFSSTTNLI